MNELERGSGDLIDPGGLLPAEQKVLDALGHLPLDFRACVGRIVGGI